MEIINGVTNIVARKMDAQEEGGGGRQFELEPMEEQNESTLRTAATNRTKAHRKRVFFLTFILAFFSFVVLLVDMLLQFTTKLTDDDRLWSFLTTLNNEKNHTKVCSICPLIPHFCNGSLPLTTPLP